MRALLAISVLALTACTAETDVESVSDVQIQSTGDVLQHIQNKIEKEEVRNFDPNLSVTEVRVLLAKRDNLELLNGQDLPTEQKKKLAAKRKAINSELYGGTPKLRGRQLQDDSADLIKQAQIISIPGVCNTAEDCRSHLEQKAADRDSFLNIELKTQLDCHGIAKQGGLVVCQTEPNARVEVGRSETDTYIQTADKYGTLLVGFDRDEPAAFVRVGEARVDFDIKPREYDTSRIDGLPKKFVSEYTAEQLAQIRKASALKKVGFASKVEEVGFKNGFIYPVTTHTKTTNFGAQRILNGDPKRPHFGVDLAAPKGTPILAPADGIVSLASTEMYFEGSLIMIDHGQGLISYYLHNETVDVEVGQRVTQGQQIGTVGSRGRSTGPHLCWRLKWRGRNLDPELLTEWPQSG